jgi:hypothetical protein
VIPASFTQASATKTGFSKTLQGKELSPFDQSVMKFGDVLKSSSPNSRRNPPWHNKGADIPRHNLANDHMTFANDETVRAFLQVAGSEGLPLITVDGVLSHFCVKPLEPDALMSPSY